MGITREKWRWLIHTSKIRSGRKGRRKKAKAKGKNESHSKRWHVKDLPFEEEQEKSLFNQWSWSTVEFRAPCHPNRCRNKRNVCNNAGKPRTCSWKEGISYLSGCLPEELLRSGNGHGEVLSKNYCRHWTGNESQQNQEWTKSTYQISDEVASLFIEEMRYLKKYFKVCF